MQTPLRFKRSLLISCLCAAAYYPTYTFAENQPDHEEVFEEIGENEHLMIAEAEQFAAKAPLIEAIEAQNIKRVIELTKQDPSAIKAKDVYGRTALHTAAETGNKDITEHLITAGAEIDAQDMRGMTALHLMAWNEHPDITKLLLDHDAALEARDLSGRTPFLLAAYVNNAPIATLLKSKGARSRSTDDNENNAFHGEALAGKMFPEYRQETLKLLSKHGVDIDAHNALGHTPLIVAILTNNTDRAKQLIEVGANISVSDFSGNNAYDYAEDLGNEDIISLFD